MPCSPSRSVVSQVPNAGPQATELADVKIIRRNTVKIPQIPFPRLSDPGVELIRHWTPNGTYYELHSIVTIGGNGARVHDVHCDSPRVCHDSIVGMRRFLNEYDAAMAGYSGVAAPGEGRVAFAARAEREILNEAFGLSIVEIEGSGRHALNHGYQYLRTRTLVNRAGV